MGDHYATVLIRSFSVANMSDQAEISDVRLGLNQRLVSLLVHVQHDQNLTAA